MQTPVNNSAPLRCYRCLQYGHRAAVCKTNPPNFSRKPEKSEGPIPHKAKVNHVSAVETRPNVAIPLNGYKPVIEIPELRIRPPEFHEELQRRSDVERAEFIRSRDSEIEMQAQPTFDDNFVNAADAGEQHTLLTESPEASVHATAGQSEIGRASCRERV